MFFNFLYHHHYQIDVNVNGNDYVNDGDVGNDFSSSFILKENILVIQLITNHYYRQTMTY